MDPNRQSTTNQPIRASASHCQGPWSIPATLLGDQDSPLITKAKVCPVCAKELSADANFCPIDGNALFRLSAHKTDPLSLSFHERIQVPRLPRRKLFRQGSFVLLLLAAFATCAFALQTNHPSPMRALTIIDSLPPTDSVTPLTTKKTLTKKATTRRRKKIRRKRSKRSKRSKLSRRKRIRVRAKGLELGQTPLGDAAKKPEATKVSARTVAPTKLADSRDSDVVNVPRKRNTQADIAHKPISSKPYRDLDQELSDQGRKAETTEGWSI
jgi:hypothetical protein